MAIHKTITDKTGYDLEYMRIGNIHFDAIKNTYRVELLGYKSAETFESGSEPIMKRVFGLNSQKIETLDLNIDNCSANLVSVLENAATSVFEDLGDAVLI